MIENGNYDLAKTQLDKAYSIFVESEQNGPAAIALVLKSQLLTKLSKLDEASMILDDICIAGVKL